ncbi:MAG: TonB-dependent receptor [Desulfobacteraceae bacterium]|nr:TonB-dependent receptor [Desulfobacteraceae bacterium]MCB9494080.1 TonB-dependent receptor [Desulfobacteraceae bacterium]
MRYRFIISPLVKSFVSAIVMGALIPFAPIYADTKDSVMESLTVTAQKREENLQDVPMSIDLFTDITLEDYGLDSMSDVIFQSANVFMKTNTAENPIIIRGISSFKSAIFSPAGFYVDDVSSPLSYMTNPDLLDIKRIEILKGPQGTLYGRNTLSGLVNIVTRQPDNDFRGRINLEAGAYDSKNNGMIYRAGTAVSGPVKEDLLFMGISVQALNSDGFRTDIVNNDERSSKEEHLDARTTLCYAPSDSLDISFTASGSDHDDGFGVYRLVNGPYSTPGHTVNSGDPGLGKEQKNNSQNLKVNYRGNGWDIVSITSRMSYDIDFTTDMDFMGGPMYSGFGFDDTQWSQEIRLTSDDDKALRWLVGLYGFREETGTFLDIRKRTESSSAKLWNPEGDIDMKGYAVFSQAEWQLNPKWEATMGLRFDHQSLSGKVDNNSTGMMPFLPSSQSFSQDLSHSELLPKFALGYSPCSWAKIYASAAKGYQVGGYNYSMVMSEDTFTYGPEYAWNYETGIKTVFFDNRLRINSSLFYVDIKDKQIDVNNPDATGVPMAPDISNAGKVHTCGAEISIHADPKPSMSFFATFGFLKTEIDRWSSASKTGVIDYQGNELPYSPEYTYAAGGTYRMNNGIFLSSDINGTGSYYGEPGNNLKQDAFELVNLRAGYETEAFDIVFWCKNIFDQEYFTVADEVLNSGVLKGVEGDPRTYGVTMRYRF